MITIKIDHLLSGVEITINPCDGNTCRAECRKSSETLAKTVEECLIGVCENAAREFEESSGKAPAERWPIYTQHISHIDIDIEASSAEDFAEKIKEELRSYPSWAGGRFKLKGLIRHSRQCQGLSPEQEGSECAGKQDPSYHCDHTPGTDAPTV